MHQAFSRKTYTLQRKILSIANQYRIFNPEGNLVMYSKQKMFKLREDIRVYQDEEMSRELLVIKAQQVIDFAASYQVIDASSGASVGFLRRKGFSSLVRDHWQLLTPSREILGKIEEDQLGKALLRRLLLGSLLPQSYSVDIGGKPAAEFRQNFHLLRYELVIDFSLNDQQVLDPRLGLAAAVLLAAIDGKQD